MRKYGPIEKFHPSIGTPCPACWRTFKPGDYITLIPVGPGENPEAQERMKQNKPYDAVALEVHWDCIDPRIFKEDE